MGDMAGGLLGRGKEVDMLGNFLELQFLLPFTRGDVFREVVSSQAPIGIEKKKVMIRVLKSVHNSSPIDALEVGCIREMAFHSVGGRTVSEVIKLEQDWMIKWQELETTVGINAKMIGIGRHKPTFAVYLEDAPAGTRVRVRYEFYRVETRGLCGSRLENNFPAAIATTLDKTLRDSWTTDMLKRGYQHWGIPPPQI